MSVPDNIQLWCNNIVFMMQQLIINNYFPNNPLIVILSEDIDLNYRNIGACGKSHKVTNF